jgi:hypothetical protein
MVLSAAFRVVPMPVLRQAIRRPLVGARLRC